MKCHEEYVTTGNSAVYRKRHKQKYAGCTFCTWHGGENATRSKRGENKPRTRVRRGK